MVDEMKGLNFLLSLEPKGDRAFGLKVKQIM